MQKGYFESYTYDTPEKEKLNLWERFLLDNRFYFTLKYAVIVFKTRKEAGEFERSIKNQKSRKYIENLIREENSKDPR